MAAKTRSSRKSVSSSAAGTYVYDKGLGRVVKVSDRIPKVASKGRGAWPYGKGPGTATPETGPCGRSVCAGGRCANG